jgi:hypothetical protein
MGSSFVYLKFLVAMWMVAFPIHIATTTTIAFAYNTHFAIYNGSVAKIVASILIFGIVRKSPEDG